MEAASKVIKMSQECKRKTLIIGLGLIVLLVVASCQADPKQTEAQVAVVAEGLINPVGMVALPDGSLFIAEEGTGANDLSAGVSLMTADGQIGRFVSGLPSSRDSGDLSGAPLVTVSPDGTTLYIGNFGAGHLWTLPLAPGASLTLPAQPYGPEQLGTAMEPLNNV
jgi:secreted PhoX family phosphatase